MSSFRNAISRRAHKERAQPADRAKFGLLEKHKDYVVRAKAYHKKEETIRRLREKAASRNPDEFYFKMINSRKVDGVFRPGQQNSYSHEELMIMKTQDVGYLLQKIQKEKKDIERLTSVLHAVNRPHVNTHTHFAEDREELKELCSRESNEGKLPTSRRLPRNIGRKVASSYKELEARRTRLRELEKIHMDMVMQMEMRKKGRKRKLREDELVVPTDRPVYKWRTERKR